MRSARRRMKGDRVTVRILCDEEATEGAIGKGDEDGAASLNERVVHHAGVVARDPEYHAHAEWPSFGKRPGVAAGKLHLVPKLVSPTP